MNKWTMLSLVVLVAILSISLWLITQAQDPLLEAESAAEQEIGIEEFEGGIPEATEDMTDDDFILEPDLSMDEGTDDTLDETIPSDPFGSESLDSENETENSIEPTDN